jgi:dTDP-4-dehydrorhamnose reductase
MLRLAGERSEVAVVDDQFGTQPMPLTSPMIAIVERLVHHTPTSRWGIYHAVNEGSASWRDVAEAIFRVSRELGGPWATVRGIPSGDYRAAATRPANLRLDTSKLANAFDIRLDDWRNSCHLCGASADGG